MLRRLLARANPPESARFEQDLLRTAAELQLEKTDFYGHAPNQALPAEMTAGAHRVAERWPGGRAGVLAADMYFAPLTWQPRYPGANPGRWGLLKLLVACLVSDPPPDIAARLEARMALILQSPYDSSERWQALGNALPALGSAQGSFAYCEPALERCLWLLSALPATPATLDLIEQVVRGGLDYTSIQYPATMRGKVPSRAYTASSQELASYMPYLMQSLFEHGRFGYEVYREAALHLPSLAAWAGTRTREGNLPGRAGTRLSAEFVAVMGTYGDRLAGELADGLAEDNWHVARCLPNLRGSLYLLAAARHHAAYRLGKLVYDRYQLRDGLDTAIVHFAGAQDAEPHDPAARAQILAELRRYPVKTLKYLMPVARHARGLLLEALGWQAAWPLVQEVVRVAGLDAGLNAWEQDLRNSPDPGVGVIDAAAARALLVEAGEELAREVLDLLAGAKIHADHAVMLFEAVGGWNRAEVERGLSKRIQNAVRAYGLLPITGGPDEILARYLFLREFERTSRQFGVQRQANETAAAQAALANLAQVAGYGSAGRLEWAMEARQARGAAALGQTWPAGEYEIELALEGLDARLTVHKAGKPLRTVPPAVRKTTVYGEAQAAQARLREQVARFRAALEQQMALGEPFDPAELAQAVAVPAAHALLSRLILIDESGRAGLYDPGAGGLCDRDGRGLPAGGPVRVAHPLDLFRNGQLGAWQREIVRRRLVQPFKQAYRELYLLTPAEEATRIYSARFAGQRLTARVVYRLLQSRQWQFGHDEPIRPARVFPTLGLQAFFEFPNVGHFFAEEDIITTGLIFFARYPQAGWAWAEPDEIAVPLTTIPPLIFSEVMRDADLLVAVAQAAGDAQLSAEGYQRRSELVANLLADLAVPGVTLEGHYAAVQGRRAGYRVHLASGAVYIGPTHHLCIVPDHAGEQPDNIYLPFLDEGNPKLVEIISKILFLANDQAIRDPSILAQIATANAAQGQ